MVIFFDGLDIISHLLMYYTHSHVKCTLYTIVGSVKWTGMRYWRINYPSKVLPASSFIYFRRKGIWTCRNLTLEGLQTGCWGPAFIKTKRIIFYVNFLIYHRPLFVPNQYKITSLLQASSQFEDHELNRYLASTTTRKTTSGSQ